MLGNCTSVAVGRSEAVVIDGDEGFEATVGDLLEGR